MAKFKFKTSDNPTLDEVEETLDEIASIDSNEIPFNHLKKIAEYLGAVYEPHKGGSRRRFKHELLTKYHQYQHGYFGVDVIHSGKAEERARKRDVVKYYLPAVRLLIIELKQKDQES